MSKEVSKQEKEVKQIEIKTPFEAVEYLYYMAKKASDGIIYDQNILFCANFAINSIDSMMQEIDKLKKSDSETTTNEPSTESETLKSEVVE